LARWSSARGQVLANWQRTLAEMRSGGSADFATLTVGVNAVRNLAGS
jgi:NAD-specific glutamate dehydrogenase